MKPESVAVLLINGRDPAAQRLACFLTAQGIRVTAVADAVAGQLEARSQIYDCVLVDLGGVIDALAITRVLRTECGAPIVFIASTRDVAERIDALEAGADDCVALPFSDRELLSRIRASVRRARGFHTRP